MKYTAIILAFVLLYSCSSQKHIATENHSVNTDSVRVIDSLKLEISQLVTSYEKKLTEARKTSVTFEKVPCPDQVVNVPENCDKDTLLKIIKKQAQQINSLQNTVKVNADGSVEYSGRIAEVQTSLDRTQNELSTVTATNLRLQHLNDSLGKQLQLADSRTKVDKKSGFLNNIGFIISLALIALVVGMIIGYRISKSKLNL